jgi:transcription elongation factor GreA
MPTYVSADGLEKMKQELEDRRIRVRREIAERISSAKELGDLSENFEYQEAKEQQSMNEARVMDLENMIKDSVIVEQTSGGSTIALGTTFVADLNGRDKTFEIVGSSEADPIAGKISNESPLGQAFIGRGAGDDVEIEVPSGKIVYKIKKIK